MGKNSLGELKLSPLKEKGQFVFLNREIRVNGKMNKGDLIKIFVPAYEQRGGKHYLHSDAPCTIQLVVRNTPVSFEPPAGLDSVEAVYQAACEAYKNQFYFGKVIL